MCAAAAAAAACYTVAVSLIIPMQVLELDPCNIKALYRRAQARIGTGDLLEAELDIKAGLLNEPDNADLNALNRKLK
jgi:FK506-binding protein 4/5